jgi:hypothetical protein
MCSHAGAGGAAHPAMPGPQPICDKQRLWWPPRRDGLASVMVAGVHAQLQDQSFAPGKALELLPGNQTQVAECAGSPTSG